MRSDDGSIEVDPRVPENGDEFPFPQAKQFLVQVSVKVSVQSEITVLAGKTYRHSKPI